MDAIPLAMEFESGSEDSEGMMVSTSEVELIEETERDEETEKGDIHAIGNRAYKMLQLIRQATAATATTTNEHNIDFQKTVSLFFFITNPTQQTNKKN